ncbi:MAG: hypothetical protein JOZ62_00980, partial [Acidobacteriaceae bacterium]|nr:hypothetical protein [Acidobacteriaceae bacterium]
SVITSSQRTEEGSLARDTTSGVPGTQTNLPRPPVRPPTQPGAGVARRTENIAYETNRTVRRMRLPQGIIRRMTVSVLVDQNLRWQMAGKGKSAHPERVIEPPSADRMKSIQAVVAATTGLNTTRGDQITVETQPFEATLTAEPPASMVSGSSGNSTAGRKFSPMLIGGIGGGVLILGVLAFFFLRKRRAAKAEPPEMPQQLESGSAGPAELGWSGAAAGQQQQVEGLSSPGLGIPQAEHGINLPPLMTSKTEILTRQVNEQVEKDPAALARIVRTWLNEAEES